jgi:tetratricopeptide (TPR) repeat protein
LARAAEHAYGGVDPLRYAGLLVRRGGDQAQSHLVRVAYGHWPADVRAEAFAMLQSAPDLRDRPAARRRYLLEAMRLSGGRVGLNDLGVVENGLGHSEAALRHYREQLRRDRNDRLTTAERRTASRLITESNVAAMTGNYLDAFGIACHVLRIEACSGEAMIRAVLGQPALLNDFETNYRLANASRTLGVLHQPSTALRIIALGRGAAAANAEVTLPMRRVRDADWLVSELEVRRQMQDWPGLLATYRAFEVNAQQRAVPISVNGSAYLPLALAHTGDWAGARAAAAALPSDCMRCVWYRAQIADLSREARAADALFAEAVRQAPSMGFAETDWARALLARDVRGAIAHAAHAHNTSPRFADPLEVWGEALLAKGDAGGAARKLAAAAAFAPKWGRLHLKWGEALAAEGKAAEAQAQWRAAAAMDLTTTERTELARTSRGG